MEDGQPLERPQMDDGYPHNLMAPLADTLGKIFIQLDKGQVNSESVIEMVKTFKPLVQLMSNCVAKSRVLQIINDFETFDKGLKRPNKKVCMYMTGLS